MDLLGNPVDSLKSGKNANLQTTIIKVWGRVLENFAQRSDGQQDVVQRSERLGISKLDRKPGYIRSFFNSRYESINSRKYVDYFYNSILNIMEDVKSGNNNYYPNEYYKAMGMPSPEQYIAFNELYSFFNNDYFDKQGKGLYNLARLSRKPIALKIIKDIYDNFEIEPVKKITIVCGSFWRKPLWLRGEIINYLNKLNAEHNVEVELFTNCADDEEDGIENLNDDIYANKFHRLKNRVMIHYILADDKKLYIEYPHSEKHYLRLYMLLTSKELDSPELKDKKQKIIQFLKGLIEKASNSQ
jgi:hypothetical protein